MFIATILILTIFTSVFSEPQKAGIKRIDGINHTVFRDPDTKEKYFFDRHGHHWDTRDYDKSFRNKQRAKYGKKSVRVLANLSRKGSQKIRIFFEPEGPVINKKDEKQMQNRSRGIHAKGMKSLRKNLPKIDFTDLDPSELSVCATVTNSQLKKIERLSNILSIQSAEPFAPLEAYPSIHDRGPPPGLRPSWEHKPFDEIYDSEPAGIDPRETTLYTTDFGNGGSGINIGIIEAYIITPIHNNLLDYTRHDTYPNPGSPPTSHWHGGMVMSLLKNNQTGNSGIFRGGARNSNLHFAWIGTTSGSSVNDIVSGTNADVINHSYGMTIWHPQRVKDMWRVSYDIDNSTHGGDWVLHTMSAGNENSGLSLGYMDCMASGVWSDEQCRSIIWGGVYNAVVVGALEDFGHKASYSSWRNCPVGADNELPHVVAVGNVEWKNIDTTNSTGSIPLMGTSYAAPQIAALVANSMSHNMNYRSYPELQKAMLLAASHWRFSITQLDPPVGHTNWPMWSGNTDIDWGAGLPAGFVMKQILDNNVHTIWDNQTVPTNGYYAGAGSFQMITEGSSKTFHIPVSSCNGCKVSFYLTWVSDFQNVPRGEPYLPDDIDLYVTGTVDYGEAWSSSNTTEAVHLTTDGGVNTYTVTVNFWSKNSVPSSAAWCGLSWYVHG